MRVFSGIINLLSDIMFDLLSELKSKLCNCNSALNKPQCYRKKLGGPVQYSCQFKSSPHQGSLQLQPFCESWLRCWIFHSSPWAVPRDGLIRMMPRDTLWLKCFLNTFFLHQLWYVFFRQWLDFESCCVYGIWHLLQLFIFPFNIFVVLFAGQVAGRSKGHFSCTLFCIKCAELCMCLVSQI